VASKFARFESGRLQVWGIFQRRCSKVITDLDELKQRLRMELAELDHVAIAASSIDPDLFSDACFVHFLSQYSYTL